MSSEKVVNARHLTGDGPLWMLCEQARDATETDGIRLIVSQERTATAVLRALLACGLSARLDPIGEEFHILCRSDDDVAAAVRGWLNREATGVSGQRVGKEETNLT